VASDSVAGAAAPTGGSPARPEDRASAGVAAALDLSAPDCAARPDACPAAIVAAESADVVEIAEAEVAPEAAATVGAEPAGELAAT
jgi:hypothetical protein